MCDYSLQTVRSRPAKVGDKLTTRNFGTGTHGFAAAEDRATAVCVLPGTELAFSRAVSVSDHRFIFGRNVETLAHATAIFRQVNQHDPRVHHDALNFRMGALFFLQNSRRVRKQLCFNCPHNQRLRLKQRLSNALPM